MLSKKHITHKSIVLTIGMIIGALIIQIPLYLDIGSGNKLIESIQRPSENSYRESALLAMENHQHPCDHQSPEKAKPQTQTHLIEEPKYLLYDQTHGSLSNQLVSFVNAAIQAKRHKLILVVPPAFTPGGIAAFKTSNNRMVYLLGTFFDRKVFEKGADIKTMLMEEFLESADGKRYTLDKNDPSHVAQAVPFIAARESDVIAITKMYTRKDWQFNTTFVKYFDAFPRYSSSQLSWCAALQRVDIIMDACMSGKLPISCKLILLDNVFSNYYDCTHVDPNFLAFRQHIKPVPEIHQTVDEFLSHYRPAPVITIHVRHIGADDKESDFLKKMQRQLEQGIELLKQTQPRNTNPPIIYVMGMRARNEEYRVDNVQQYLMEKMGLNASRFASIQTDLPNVVISRNTNHVAYMSSWAEQLDPTKQEALFGMEYSMLVIDQYICVMSDLYIGRKASTFSIFVESWRTINNKPTIMF